MVLELESHPSDHRELDTERVVPSKQSCSCYSKRDLKVQCLRAEQGSLAPAAEGGTLIAAAPSLASK